MNGDLHDLSPLENELRRALDDEASRIRPSDLRAEIIDRAGQAGRRRTWANRVAPLGVAAALVAIATVIWSAGGPAGTAPAGHPSADPSAPATSPDGAYDRARELQSADPSAPATSPDGAYDRARELQTADPSAPATSPDGAYDRARELQTADPSAPATSPDGAYDRARELQTQDPSAPSVSSTELPSLGTATAGPGLTIEADGPATIGAGRTPSPGMALEWTLDRDGVQITSGRLFSDQATGAFRIPVGVLRNGRYRMEVWQPGTGPSGARYAIDSDFVLTGNLRPPATANPASAGPSATSVRPPATANPASAGPSATSTRPPSTRPPSPTAARTTSGG
ncbi:serine/threonine-protein kinase [Nakamurella lactea]|uniref:hypothetical protein n=1 Tax=Nakamurella lactea TaxID=459515 RepID=UPI0003F9ED2E|nr:hypothetical protein [Nakamurella lactea]